MAFAAVFVEDQVAGLQMDGILEFFWSGLIGTGEARWVRYQIDLHIAFGSDVAGFLVIGKIVAVDLVEARGIPAVEHDADVVQLGVAVELELLDVACLDGEERAFAVGL